MNYFFKKNFLIFFLIIIASLGTEAFGKSNKIKYSKDDISNYFSGVISYNQDYTSTAFKYLDKVRFLKNEHPNFNNKFIRALVLLEKYKQAFNFQKIYGLKINFFSKLIFC